MTVAVIMGSASDLPTMAPAIDTLAHFGVDHEVDVVSAHRDPLGMVRFAEQAHERGIAVVIAGAGGAAHLPGMVASLTHLPVIGVPVPLPRLDGLDALLSIAQMPAGVPVATMAIGGAANAALLAIRILAVTDARLAAALVDHRRSLVDAAARGRHEIAAHHAGSPAPTPD